MKMKVYYKGFTLAEVLVTLAVIGIVASITIPAMLKNIENAKFRTQAKSAYSSVSQAMNLAMSDNSGSFLGIFTAYDSNDARDNLKKYFHYVRECDAGSSDGVCWPNGDKFLNGNDIAWSDVPAIVLTNGVFVRFYTWPGGDGATCTDTNYFEAPGSCGGLEIDVNGFAGPNVLGKDIHWVHVLKDGIKPGGVDGSKHETIDCTSAGGGCLAKMLTGEI